MLLFLILFLILVPLIEIGILIEIGSLIGIWATLSAIIITAILGSTLVRYQGLGILREAKNAFANGCVPVREMIDGICLMLSGIFLLAPGFVTDTFGILLLIPLVRKLLGGIVLSHFLDRGRDWRNVDPHPSSRHTGGSKSVEIDGEYTVSTEKRGSHIELPRHNSDEKKKNKG